MKNRYYEEYSMFYVDIGIILYKEKKLIQLFETENEAIAYIERNVKTIGYYVERYIPKYSDTPTLFLMEERHRKRLPSICKARGYVTGYWENGAYTGKKEFVKPPTVSIHSSFNKEVAINGLIDVEPYQDIEDKIIAMSDKEYEAYLNSKRKGGIWDGKNSYYYWPQANY